MLRLITLQRQIRTHALPLAAILFAAIALPGCSDDGASGDGKSSGGGKAPSIADSSPGDIFEAVNSLLDGGDPANIWRLMPASYQSDVNGLISDFANKMDPELWNQGFAIFGKIVQVLETKGDFVLGYPMVMMMTSQADPADLKAGLDSTTKTLASIAKSDIRTLDGLKNLNVESFISKTVGDTIKTLLKTAGSVGSSMGEQNLPGKMGIAILSNAGDTAIVETTDTDGVKEEHAMVKVEGRWVQKDMADQWSQKLEEARDGLADLQVSEEDKAQAVAIFGMVGGFLDKMLLAEEQEDFNDVVNSATQMAGAMGG